MNTILETLNIKGFDVNILADRDAENPLAWGSATLVTAHRRYTFGGDRLPFDANSIEEAFDWHLDSKGLTRRDVIWLPVYLYDHSGLAALSDTPFGDRWDSGQLGYIYESRSAIRAEYRVQRISAKREQSVLERLRHILQLLEHWANGDVYAWEIPALDEYGGGFYGWDHDTSGLLEYATDAIDAHLRQERQKREAAATRPCAAAPAPGVADRPLNHPPRLCTALRPRGVCPVGRIPPFPILKTGGIHA